MEFKYLPKDILSPTFSLVDPEDLVWIGSCGDKKFMERLSREGLVSSVTLTGCLNRFYGGSGSFPFSSLSTPTFSSLTRIVIHYQTVASHISSWLWDPCFLPSTLTEIDFSFHNAFEAFLQPLRDDNNPHWMLRSMYSNNQTPPDQLFTPMLLCNTFPKLEKLRISGSLFSPKQGIPVHWGVKRPYQDLQHPTLSVWVNWTKAMLWLFLKKLPSSLTSLDLSISADALDEVPELPSNLTSLRYCEGVAPATHTLRFWLKLPESHRPDLSTLPNFQWDWYFNSDVVVDKFASEIVLFSNIRSLDISKVHLRSVADLEFIPPFLTHLKFNFHHTYGRLGTLNMKDVSMFPRTITHLTLLQCPWVDPYSKENANNFCSLLPPNLTYFYIGDLKGHWKLSIAFSEMRTSLKHLHTLIIDTPNLELHTFDPWLPCDTLHTLEILETPPCPGGIIMDPALFSSWPTDIPNNIKSLKFRLLNCGGGDDDELYEDEHLQQLPPHLTSLTLEGWSFRISPSLFGILPKSVTFLELLSTSFTRRIRGKIEGDKDGSDGEVAGKEEEEEEDYHYSDRALKDTVIVRHCPKHIIELHMDCIFTGAFLPPNVTKLTKTDYDHIEVIPRPQQLPNQLRYCNFRYIKLDSNCIIPDTLTELDFSPDSIDRKLVSQIPNLQRLSGFVTAHTDLSTCSTSLKYLRLFSSLDQFFVPPKEGDQTAAFTSLQELVLQSAWAQEVTAYELSKKFPNITSLKIVDHHNIDGNLLFPVLNNKKGKTDGLVEADCTIPRQLPPVLSKLQHLEVLGGDLIVITQSQLKHVTPNLKFLTSSVLIDDLKEILQSFTPGITNNLTEIDIIKAICPSITTLGAPPKIVFSGQDISFPIDYEALSQLDETLEKVET